MAFADIKEVIETGHKEKPHLGTLADKIGKDVLMRILEISDEFRIPASSKHKRNFYVPTDSITQLEIVNAMMWLIDEGFAQEGDAFRDLGCGVGDMSVLAEAMGFVPIGYDINQDLITTAHDLQAALVREALVEGSAEFKHMSYYPATYIPQLRDIQTRLLEVGAILGGDIYPTLRYKTGVFNRRHVPRKELQEGKVFYAYTYAKQTPSVLNLFAKYAQQGSCMYLNEPAGLDIYKSFIDRLGLKQIKNRVLLKE